MNFWPTQYHFYLIYYEFQNKSLLNTYFKNIKKYYLKVLWGFPDSSDGKTSAYNEGDPGSIPGSGRSPGEGNGNPLQYSCLENPMDKEAW